MAATGFDELLVRRLVVRVRPWFDRAHRIGIANNVFRLVCGVSQTGTGDGNVVQLAVLYILELRSNPASWLSSLLHRDVEHRASAGAAPNAACALAEGPRAGCRRPIRSATICHPAPVAGCRGRSPASTGSP